MASGGPEAVSVPKRPSLLLIGESRVAGRRQIPNPSDRLMHNFNTPVGYILAFF